MEEVAYIVPFYGKDRKKAIRTVIANIKAQRFPRIEIIISEHAAESQIKFDAFGSVRHVLAKAKTPGPFCKAAAVNRGAYKATCDKIILHDADMLVTADYTRKIMHKLQNYDACHIGFHVVYMDEHSTNHIVKHCELKDDMTAKMSVGYFEGGSLGCSRKAYFNVGGFCEMFVGYGCEDCEFFERLSHLTKFFNMRTESFLHLNHARTSGWQRHHLKNKKIYVRMKGKPMETRRLMLLDELRKGGYSSVIDKLGIKYG